MFLTGFHLDAEASRQKVIIPAPQSVLDTRYVYLVEILNKSMLRTVDTHGPYELIEIEKSVSETRGIKELENNTGLINLLWSSTSTIKEAKLRAIRIPIYKGMLGYRLLLTVSGQLEALKGVRSLADIRRFIVGQGHSWGDITVYQHHKIDVVTSPNYEGLFKMLLQRRFDIFPRGLTEIYTEHDARKSFLPDLTIEPSLYIYYPWPYYFFTSMDDERLAARINIGLERMIETGEYDSVFFKHYLSSLKRARLKQRRVIELTNPMLPKATPLNRKELWLDIDTIE